MKIYFVSNNEKDFQMIKRIGGLPLISYYPFYKAGKDKQTELPEGALLDSGAFSLYSIFKKTGKPFYDTKEFWEYLNSYCLFIKRNKKNLAAYVSLDVIGNPEASWEVQQHIERVHNLTPMPVFHFGESTGWLKKYIERYEYIGIGGMGKYIGKRNLPYVHLEPAFKLIFKMTGGKIKVHGFAMTTIDWLKRFPWYSVDSTTYRVEAGYGAIFTVPYDEQKMGFDYSAQPKRIYVSPFSTTGVHVQGYKNNIDNLKKDEREAVEKYLQEEMPQFKLGKSKFLFVPSKHILKENERIYSGKSGKTKDKSKILIERIIEPGLANNAYLRTELNMIYYMRAVKTITKAREEGNLNHPFLRGLFIEEEAHVKKRTKIEKEV